jgi:hypothetical protein
VKTDTSIAADVRALIVRQLGAALAAAWQRQQKLTPENDERPARLTLATGRDVRGDKDREHDESTIPV